MFNQNYWCVCTHIYIILTGELSSQKGIQQCSYINYLNTQGEAISIVHI